MRMVSLFAGIGGFDLAAEWTGQIEVVGQVEIADYPTRVLERHWPDVPRIRDVRDYQGHEFGPVDILTGGYPCQPFSLAGRRDGASDPRHLWPQVNRIIRNARPQWVLLENVPGHLSLGFGQVLADLAESGYDAEWDCIPASAVGAPHRRDRVWIVAYPNDAAGVRDAARPLADTQLDREMVNTNNDGRATPQGERRPTPRSDNGATGTIKAEQPTGSSSTPRAVEDSANVAYPQRDRPRLEGMGRNGRSGGQGRQPTDAPESAVLRQAHGPGGAEGTHASSADVAHAPSEHRNERPTRTAERQPFPEPRNGCRSAGMAHPNHKRRHDQPHARPRQGTTGHVAATASGSRDATHQGWATEPNMGRVVNGLPPGMDRRTHRERLTGLGNAIVPQVAYSIFQRILATDPRQGHLPGVDDG